MTSGAATCKRAPVSLMPHIRHSLPAGRWQDLQWSVLLESCKSFAVSGVDQTGCRGWEGMRGAAGCCKAVRCWEKKARHKKESLRVGAVCIMTDVSKTGGVQGVWSFWHRGVGLDERREQRGLSKNLAGQAVVPCSTHAGMGRGAVAGRRSAVALATACWGMGHGAWGQPIRHAQTVR